ncbi:MAG: hypothetical protein GC160_05905 [Acidobacteria bacterium]|nr:hypothetical protein [Acidobacteriota bacterium]
MRAWTTLLLLTALGCGSPDERPLVVSVLSSRPDMVTGGDALVEIAGADGEELSVSLNGRDVSEAFEAVVDASRRSGLVTGLELGDNRLEVRGGGRSAELTLVNYPRSGPVFSGPHQEPFPCETERAGLGAPVDADCSAETRVDLYYRSSDPKPPEAPAAGGVPAGFRPFDPAAPRPADMAQATTSAGRTLDFVVRVETGTINRAIYQIATLYDPGQPNPRPAAPGAAWNGRLVYRFGGGCRAGYRQAQAPSALSADLLGRGYAVAASSLNVFGNNCNDVLSAETMMMVKERFIETYGPPVHTIGTGGSGGSMQQHLIAQNYPGLLDGIIPGASYPDIVTLVPPVTDCSLLDEAFRTSGLSWSDEQKTAVSGYATWKSCESWMKSFSPAWLEPGACAAETPRDEVYDAARKPDGVRCDLQDNMVNLIGRDPATGHARRFVDNVGVEYGRRAFEDGVISAEQFVALNEKAGGYDGDAHIVGQRSVADPEALAALYGGGRVNAGAGSFGSVPIIDTRQYLDPSGNIHDRVRTFLMASRLEKANGGAGNRVMLTNPPAELDAVALMDRWLDAIGQDKAGGESIDVIARNRPEELSSACWSEDGERISDEGTGRCAELYPAHGDPRIVAGASAANDVLKCALRPLRAENYGRKLSPEQLRRLQAVFPDGVCDYSKPGIGQQPPRGVWQRF